MSSETSALQGRPRVPRLRKSTSPPIASAIARMSAAATSMSASRTRPYQVESCATVGMDPLPLRRLRRLRPGMTSPSRRLREQFLQLRPVLGTLLDDAGPARLVGLLAPVLARRAGDIDDLHAGLLLLFGLVLVLLHDLGLGRLGLLAGLGQNRALLVSQAVPFALVDEDRDLGRVEAGVDAVFRLLMPAEVEDAGDRPAIAVDDAALERGIDFARSGLDHGRALRLEEVAVDRRDAQLEAGEVRPGDRLVEVEVEGVVVDRPRQEMRLHLLGIALLHIVEAAVLAQLRHRALGELPGVSLRHDIGVGGAGHVRDIDDAVLQRIADLEWRHRLRPADVLDADDAPALAVHAVDELLEAARIEGVLGEGRDAAKDDLL